MFINKIKGGEIMSNFIWCILGMIVTVLVGIWRAKTFAGIARVFFIIGAVVAFIFFLIGAIALSGQGM